MVEQDTTIRAGLIKRVHVDQRRVRAHHPNPITVQARGGPYKGASVRILGESETIYRPEKPLSCGARLWVETKAEVVITVAEWEEERGD